MEEDRDALSAYFLTLTYATDNLPFTKNGFKTVSKRDVQLFFKRLRKAHDKYHRKKWVHPSRAPKLKYYAAAEYGTERRRPHYHIILFNAVLELIDPAWNLGAIYYGNVSGASVGYTLKYMCKGRWKPDHQNDDRNPEFSLMSKGLGKRYLTEAMKRWHLASLTQRMYCNLEDGRKIAMPRYYKLKLYTDEQRNAINATLAKAQEDAFWQDIKDSGGTIWFDSQGQRRYQLPENYYRDKQQAAEAAFRRQAAEALRRQRI